MGKVWAKIPINENVDNIGLRNKQKHSENLEYENLVFEGGGAKGIAYAGALQFLQERGLLDKDGQHSIKRFAGTSVGAIVACLLSVGYGPDELFKVLEPVAIRRLTSGGSIFSKVYSLRKVFTLYGLNSTRSPKSIIGKYIQDKTGDADLTFKQLYKRTGKELCVVVTNVNRLTIEYFHVKRTPDIKIKDAVVMSMSLPGYFMASRCKIGRSKHDDFYVDGGLLCNYAIHCFDGWFLSMATKDSYFKRVKSLGDYERDIFEGYNPKTLGILVFAESENQWMRNRFESRDGNLEPHRPEKDTPLYLARDLSNKKIKQITKYKDRRMAAEEFINICNLSKDKITKEEFRKIFEHDRLTPTYKQLLFKDMRFEEFYHQIDKNANGEVEFTELLDYIETLGVLAGNKYKGFNRKEINSLKSYGWILGTALVQHAQFSNLKPDDVNRSIAINTGYIDTLDFDLDSMDKDFLVKRGYNAAKKFYEWKET